MTIIVFQMISMIHTGINVVMPANGETVTFDTLPSIPVDMSLNLLKRHTQQACKLCRAIRAYSRKRIPRREENFL